MKILAVMSLLAALAAPAGATTVSAIGSGWISITGASNAPGFGAGLHNNDASYDATVSNDWFAFGLPGARIGSATLSIFNSGANRTVYPTSVFEVHAPTAFSFAGLGAGPALGTITVGAADSGTDGFVNIELNTLGIRYLNAHRGQIVELGGAIAPAVNNYACLGCIGIFGFGNGTPAATLTLGAVPDAAVWGLMVIGFGLVGSVVRRDRCRLTV